MKLLHVVGNRPQLIKLAAFLNAAKHYPEITNTLVDSGQHYDFALSQVFFEGLDIPKPEYNLGVGSDSHATQTGNIMIKLEKILLEEKPDAVVVYGNTNTTLAGALATVKLHIPIAHIEAGGRCFDRTLPEEVNCLLPDHVSDFLFTSSHFESENLLREGVDKNKIFLAGNIMTDILLRYKKSQNPSDILKKLGVRKRAYALLTLHRAGNADDEKNLKEILEAIGILSEKIPVVFPMHPRTKKMIEVFKLQGVLDASPRLYVSAPLSYADMVHLMQHAKLVLTDSGGVQHETTVLGIPCLTLRENTEWHITLDEGTNTLVGTSKKKILKKAFEILSGKAKKGRTSDLWDGHAAERIVNILRKQVKS